MEVLNTQIQTLLARKEQALNLRQLKSINALQASEILINGNKLINFASNDYLGLSQHPLLKERAIKAIEQYGVGCPSSRLISGNLELYEQIESNIARLKGTQAALVFPTGFQTNLSVLQALSKLNAFFFCDKLCHNSILLGAQLSNKAFTRFAHNNIADLKRLLDKESNKNNWIVTESVFSMDGDIACIDNLRNLAKKTNCHLYIDEAHATGVFGKNGMGLVSNPEKTTVIMGTFGKGCGSFGAYIACSKPMRDFLVNYAAGFIYTTALPPAVLASIQAALEIIPQMVSQRQELLQTSARLRDEINQIGFNTGQSNSQIVSILLGDNELALSLSQYLEENKIYARAIRPPTVPENTARIRLSLSAIHSNLDIERLITVLRNWYAS